MNGSITHYADATHEPQTVTSGTSGLLHLDVGAYAPRILLDDGDQEYLRRLAAAATELADHMDAAQAGATS